MQNRALDCAQSSAYSAAILHWQTSGGQRLLWVSSGHNGASLATTASHSKTDLIAANAG